MWWSGSAGRAWSLTQYQALLNTYAMKKKHAPQYLISKTLLRLLGHTALAGAKLGVPVALYFLARAFLIAISELQAETKAAVLAAVITPIVTVLTVVLSHWFARRREIEQARREKKVQFYDGFLKEYFEILGSWRRGDRVSKATNRRIADLTTNTARGLILWAGEETIGKWKALQEQARTEEDAQPEGIPIILVRFAEMLFAIRKELGHSRRSIQEAGLLSLFISDVQQDTGSD